MDQYSVMEAEDDSNLTRSNQTQRHFNHYYNKTQSSIANANVNIDDDQQGDPMFHHLNNHRGARMGKEASLLADSSNGSHYSRHAESETDTNEQYYNSDSSDDDEFHRVNSGGSSLDDDDDFSDDEEVIEVCEEDRYALGFAIAVLLFTAFAFACMGLPAALPCYLMLHLSVCLLAFLMQYRTLKVRIWIALTAMITFYSYKSSVLQPLMHRALKIYATLYMRGLHFTMVSIFFSWFTFVWECSNLGLILGGHYVLHHKYNIDTLEKVILKAFVPSQMRFCETTDDEINARRETTAVSGTHNGNIGVDMDDDDEDLALFKQLAKG